MQVQAEKQELPAKWINSKTMDEDVIPKACQKQLDKLLKDISKTEKEKAPNVLESLLMIDNIEEKYNRILKEDPLVLRSENNIKLLLTLQKSKRSFAFKLAIDDVIEDKLFAMFKEIEERYGCKIPGYKYIDLVFPREIKKEEIVEDYHRGILSHPSAYEIIEFGPMNVE